eukprot:Anaeramoba_flamelloidesa568712_334.p1 GENE.a568712_334~~a568712_334.p1  ORF type:complete len:431 (-),score=94.45 a568712_334:176-1468(-)
MLSISKIAFKKSPLSLSSYFSNTKPRYKCRSHYFDFQATSPTDPRVLDKMMPYMITKQGNAHSKTHMHGWEAEGGVEEARAHVSDLIHADPKEIIFTSGATESNNIAIKGVMNFLNPMKKHVITSQIEHKCVLESCKLLESKGFDVTYLPVQRNGIIDIGELKKAIRPDTGLVSIMGVNNEIGVLQPLKEIGNLCRSNKIKFHTDCAQMFGKLPIDVNDMKIDLMSISGHKIYGPKGVGALYVRRRPRVRLLALQSGGGQERGIRSGTLPSPIIVGLGEAAKIAKSEMERDNKRIKRLADKLISQVMEKIPLVQLNGDKEKRYHGCVNLSFAFVEGESLLMNLKDFALSSGSACTSASLEPSYVLRALGVPDEYAHSSLRIGLGRFTTEKEIDFFVETLVTSVERLREMSPLYDMYLEGVDFTKINWSHD